MSTSNKQNGRQVLSVMSDSVSWHKLLWRILFLGINCHGGLCFLAQTIMADSVSWHKLLWRILFLGTDYHGGLCFLAQTVMSYSVSWNKLSWRKCCFAARLRSPLYVISTGISYQTNTVFEQLLLSKCSTGLGSVLYSQLVTFSGVSRYLFYGFIQPLKFGYHYHYKLSIA